ncbi:MAG: Ig-like domain-containing protein [Muribaculaceae bacterium]|nr:Ig-like domain-containing protein [Muribaculaceae bacterium]
MKKLFTPLLLFLTVLLGGINASAETATVPLTFDMWHIWDSATANAEYASDDKDWWNNSGGWIHKVGEEFKENGYLFKFLHANEGKFYANLSEYASINGVATPGTKLKMVFNANLGNIGQNNPGIEATIVADDNGNFEFSFDDLKNGDTPVKFVHLNTVEVNLPAVDTPCKVESINLIPKPDPLSLNASWFHQWSGFGADAQILETQEKGSVDNIGNELGEGGLVLGHASCDGDVYADLSKYGGIEGVATPGITLRFFFNRDALQGGGHPDTTVDTDANGKFTLDFSTLNVDFVHLNFVKIHEQWRGGKWPSGLDKAVIKSIKVIDPWAAAMGSLNDEIIKAKQYDSFAKTETSWDALQEAITAGESELVNEEATLQSLKTAISNISMAIKGLKLQDGYEYLAAEMFKEYKSFDTPGEGTGTGCAYELFKATGMPYGDGGVSWMKWADLAAYDKLIVTTDGINGKPRFCMNRTSPNGQEADGGMLDIAPGNNKTSTATYLTSDGNVFTIDLRKMVADCGYARLHSIKDYAGNVLVTGMYLYTSTNELEGPLEDLENEIKRAEQCDDFLKTEDSWIALQNAIEEGKAALTATDADIINGAKANITEAIAGLTLQEGYCDLTKEMFKHYTENNPDKGTTTNCDYDLFKENGSPYGDCPNVKYDNWADLTNYDKLVIRATSGTPRFCMNRLVDEGAYKATMEESNFVDIHADRNDWAAERYLQVDANVYTVDLAKMIDDYGFARLHAIKFGGYVTGMYLYKDPTPNLSFNLTFDIDNPEHVIIKIDNEEIKDLTAEANERTVTDRAKLSISPAEGFKLSSVTAGDDVYVKLNDGILTKTIVKNINFKIVTEDENPFKEEIDALNAIIEKAKLYDGTAKIKEDYEKLQPAIEAALAEIANKETTAEKLTAAGKTITDILDGFKQLAPNFSHLTEEMFKKYASVSEPGDGEDTDCKYEIFAETKNPYGSDNTDYLKWADLSDYDQLIITTIGASKPSILLNRLEANGQLAPTQEDSKIIEIYPTGDGDNNWAQYNWATDLYQSTETYKSDKDNVNTYTINLRKIVEDYGFARLHSILKQGWGEAYMVTGMYLYKDPNATVDLTFDIDDPDHVVIKVSETEITDLEAGENTKALPFRGKLSIAPAEGFEIKSLTADGKDVALTDGEYTTTILKEVAYKIVTVDPKIIKLNFNIDEASHVVISANEKEIKNLVNGSNDVEVEKGSKISIAAAEGFVLSSVKEGEEEVELTEGAYTTTVSEPVNYTILTEAEKPADPNALTGAWWHQWDGFGADAQIIETTKEIVDNLGKEVKNGTVILGNPACDGDCYADLSEYGGVEGKATAGTTVRFYFNRIDVQGAGIDIQLKTDAEGKFSYEFDELKDGGNPVSFVHLAFVKIVGDGEVESIKVLPKPSAEALAKKNLTKEIDRANLYDSYAKTDASWNKLETAISEANAALTKEDATVASLEAAKAAINEAIEGLELKEGYSYFTANMFKQHASVDNPDEGKELGSENLKLFVSTDQPLGESTISELNWADLTQYDKLVVTVKEGTPRILMNRLERGGQEYDNDTHEYLGKLMDMTAGDNHYSTERYLTSEGNAYIVDLAKMVDDFGFARLNALKFHGLVNGLYLYYKDPNVKREYDLTFDIDNASHVVVKVNGETKDMTKNSVLKVADRAKLSIAPADDFVLESVTANDESVELKDGSLTKTIVKNIAYIIVTADADPLTQPKKDLTAIIENAKLYDGTAKTEDSFAALTAAIAAAEAELDSEKADKESLKSAGDAITKAIENLVLAPNYSKLTVDMFKSHESFENPVVTDEDPGCANGLFTSSELPYGNNNNDYLKWADLSDYTQLVITTDGNYAPEFFLNRLEANGKQGATKDESKLIDINPGSADAWSSKYLIVEGKKYTVDLKKIVKDFGFARLHSIKSNAYEKGILVTGMYLYKAPFVAVTGISLDKSDEIVTVGETLTLKATVAPANATDSDVTWSSSNPKVASVDENGVVTALEVGKAVITASCGEFTAKCTVKCHSTVGDANWDGKITVTDAVHISNYVVQDFEVPEGWTAEDHKEFYERSANVNGDGRVTFADASATVNLALAQPASAPEQNRVSAANDDTADALVIGHVSATSSGNVVPVALDNTMEYVALQADIILPEGMNVEVKAGSRVAGSHTFQTRKFADNHIRVAIYNLGNVAFADSEAPIFEVVTDSDIMDSEDIVISNIYASDSKAVEYVLAARMAAPSAVAAIGFDANAPVKVFDLNGIYVSDTMEGLQQGTYIVRQGDEAKKVRIR